MAWEPSASNGGTLSRREFVSTAAATGGGLYATQQSLYAGEGKKNVDTVNIAIIGTGSQGRNLLHKCLKIPGIRFKAVCDIWSYSQKYATGILRNFDQDVNVYEDYREMLAKEADGLDAVIVATPDWVHAEHTNACLKAGLHVYCEKEMSNSLEKAASMVRTAKETGKLLQIGHQRRSNPRYHLVMKMLYKEEICGRLTHVYGQWNRNKLLKRGYSDKYEMPKEKLKKYGYDTMDRLRNWRWYKKYSGGPIADLGSHQIDVFNWFLKATPSAVQANAGVDHYPKSEWYDNIAALYTYNMEDTTVRGIYEVYNTTSWGGFYEVVMGEQGTVVISEDKSKGRVLRERTAKRRSWEDQASKVKKGGKEAIKLQVGQTVNAEGEKTQQAKKMEQKSEKPVHQLHLENFFNALREGEELSCPPEVGYETAVTVLRVNEAAAAEKKLHYDPKAFKV